jgi:hypothetical protein
MCKCGRVKGPEEGLSGRLSGSAEGLDGWRLWLDGGGLYGNVTFLGLFFVLRTHLLKCPVTFCLQPKVIRRLSCLVLSLLLPTSLSLSGRIFLVVVAALFVLGHAMSCHGMPCHAMSCRVMPCHKCPECIVFWDFVYLGSVILL